MGVCMCTCVGVCCTGGPTKKTHTHTRHKARSTFTKVTTRTHGLRPPLYWSPPSALGAPRPGPPRPRPPAPPRPPRPGPRGAALPRLSALADTGSPPAADATGAGRGLRSLRSGRGPPRPRPRPAASGDDGPPTEGRGVPLGGNVRFSTTLTLMPSTFTRVWAVARWKGTGSSAGHNRRHSLWLSQLGTPGRPPWRAPPPPPHTHLEARRPHTHTPRRADPTCTYPTHTHPEARRPHMYTPHHPGDPPPAPHGSQIPPLPCRG
jgi:hypothetical protein